MIELRKYYRPDHYLLVYLTKEKAALATKTNPVASSLFGVRADYAAVARAEYFSNQLNCKVNYSNPNDLIFVINKVEENGKTYLFCLFSEFSGWIAWKETRKGLVELKKETEKNYEKSSMCSINSI